MIPEIRNCILGLLSLLVSAAAVAQSEESDESSRSETMAQSDDDEMALESLTVTAQRREENLQDVPLSVTAIGGRQLFDAGVSDLSRLDQLVPGLQFGQSGSDARPAIRGTRTENVSVQQDPVVSFYVDGVYRSLTSQALASIVDVERVEVLRGPQGTLYGRNAFGGAVNIISNAPRFFQEFGGSISYGNFSRVRAEAYANVPLGDDLALRISGAYENHDFIVENTFNPDAGLRDKDERYLRAQLLWKPSNRMSVTVRASHWEQGGNGNSEFGYKLIGTPIDPSDDGNPITFSEVRNARLAPVNPRTGGGNLPILQDPYTIDYDFEPRLDTEQSTVDAEATYAFRNATLTAILSYTDFEVGRTADSDLSRLASSFAGQFDEVQTATQELRLDSSTDGPLTWTAGGFFLQEEKSGLFIFDRLFNTDPVTNRPDGTIATAYFSDFNALADVETDSYAAFGQASYALSERLNLTGGLRYTQDDKAFSRVTTGLNTVPVTFFEADGVTPRPVLEDSETFDQVTWRLAIDYRLAEQNLVYASVSTGFQSGGFNNSADSVTGGASFDPQEVTAYEIGSKNRFLDNRLTLNAALYFNDFDALLAQEFVDVGATTLAISTNAGQARAYGLELEADWRATRALTLNVRAAFNQAEFGDYRVNDPISGETVNLDGERIPLTPDITFGAGADHTLYLANGSLTSSIYAYYSSDYSTNDIDYAFSEQDAFTRVDARIRYTNNTGTWFVEAFGRNLTDEEIVNRTVRFGQDAIVQNYSDPAIYGVRLGLRY